MQVPRPPPPPGARPILPSTPAAPITSPPSSSPRPPPPPPSSTLSPTIMNAPRPPNTAPNPPPPRPPPNGSASSTLPVSTPGESNSISPPRPPQMVAPPSKPAPPPRSSSFVPPPAANSEVRPQPLPSPSTRSSLLPENRSSILSLQPPNSSSPLNNTSRGSISVSPRNPSVLMNPASRNSLFAINVIHEEQEDLADNDDRSEDDDNIPPPPLMLAPTSNTPKVSSSLTRTNSLGSMSNFNASTSSIVVSCADSPSVDNRPMNLNELKIEKSNDALNMSGSSMANSELSLRFPTLYKANERIKQLEYELYELKMKLERSESRLQQSCVNTTREMVLESEVQDCHRIIFQLRQEKQGLELSVQELQNRLTVLESRNTFEGSSSSADSLTMEALIQKGKREKILENQLIKAKKDKDQAVRLLIQLVGKGKISEMLNKSSNTPDILDEIAKLFS